MGDRLGSIPAARRLTSNTGRERCGGCLCPSSFPPSPMIELVSKTGSLPASHTGMASIPCLGPNTPDRIPLDVTAERPPLWGCDHCAAFSRLLYRRHGCLRKQKYLSGRDVT